MLIGRLRHATGLLALNVVTWVSRITNMATRNSWKSLWYNFRDQRVKVEEITKIVGMYGEGVDHILYVELSNV